jgi:hypothetical protein
MARNPNKKRCQIPNCRSWAMREQSHCRSHLDPKLGPRHAGPPKGNFNALKSGRYTNPLSSDELKNLAHQLAGEPDSLSRHVEFAIQSIQSRATSPLHTMILLTRLFNQLLPYMADIEYTAGLEAFMQRLPPEKRPGIQTQIWKYALPLNPLQRPLLIRAIAKRFPETFFTSKTITSEKIAGP